MLRVTADTNVLVSAIAFPRGKPRTILQMALDGAINLTVSEPILREMADVLARKFDASSNDLREARAIIKQAARTVEPAVRLDVVKDDLDDNRIVECAVTAGSEFIVTGDKDLLRLGSYDTIRIVTAAQLLAEWNQRSL